MSATKLEAGNTNSDRREARSRKRSHSRFVNWRNILIYIIRWKSVWSVRSWEEDILKKLWKEKEKKGIREERNKNKEGYSEYTEKKICLKIKNVWLNTFKKIIYLN